MMAAAVSPRTWTADNTLMVGVVNAAVCEDDNPPICDELKP